MLTASTDNNDSLRHGDGCRYTREREGGRGGERDGGRMDREGQSRGKSVGMCFCFVWIATEGAARLAT